MQDTHNVPLIKFHPVSSWVINARFAYNLCRHWNPSDAPHQSQGPPPNLALTLVLTVTTPWITWGRCQRSQWLGHTVSVLSFVRNRQTVFHMAVPSACPCRGEHSCCPTSSAVVVSAQSSATIIGSMSGFLFYRADHLFVCPSTTPQRRTDWSFTVILEVR